MNLPVPDPILLTNSHDGLDGVSVFRWALGSVAVGSLSSSARSAWHPGARAGMMTAVCCSWTPVLPYKTGSVCVNTIVSDRRDFSGINVATGPLESSGFTQGSE